MRPALCLAFLWAVRERFGIIKKFYTLNIRKCRDIGEGLSGNYNSSPSL